MSNLLKKNWFLFLVSLFSLSNLMCGFGAYDFDKDLFTTVEPDPQNMVGDYVPTEETMILIRETGQYELHTWWNVFE